MKLSERFQVTKDLVRKVLSLITGEGGLEDGAGESGSATFCVQQAVSLATGKPDADDSPQHCVNEWIISLGIALNDADGWSSDEARADGLKAFAVAELGSNQLREGSFRRKLAEKTNAKWDDAGLVSTSSTSEFVLVAEADGEEGLRALARMAVDVLVEMKSPGADYLCMVDKKEFEKPDGFGGIPVIKPATEKQREAAWLPDDAAWEDPKPVR